MQLAFFIVLSISYIYYNSILIFCYHIFYCSIGRRSAKAAGILENNGYTNVYNAVDGVTEYDFKLVK